MSAPYPLVRNFIALLTRSGVRDQAFAAGIFTQLDQQPPDQILHVAIVQSKAQGTRLKSQVTTNVTCDL